MKIGKRLLIILSLVLLVPFAASAGVTVYGEGAYTDNEGTPNNLMVYIYADVTTGDGEPLLSYGVKLMYDPSELNSPIIEKNTAQWYFGDGTTTYPTNPANTEDTSTPGQVIIIDGKLDTTSPQDGVSGDRVLLAKVTLQRNDSSTTAPSVELYLGKDGGYANFVQVNGVDLDAVLAGSSETDPIGNVSIYQRGDANQDGFLNFGDMSRIRTMISEDTFSIWADCNNDGFINFGDMSCVRTNM